MCRREFLGSVGLSALVLAAGKSPLRADDCLPEGITREDLVNLLDGPWQRLRDTEPPLCGGAI